MILQVPAVMKVAVEPDTVQTAVLFDAKETAKLEDAVALKVRGVPTV